MGIFGALTTAVSGLQAQGFALENISGNIANSQTIAFKSTNTSFEDLISEAPLSQQLSGSVAAISTSTNTVQGTIQSASTSTYMAIQGSGYFIVEKPSSQVDNGIPVFGSDAAYTRRGDFTTDQNGYLVNGAGYYLLGIPVDRTTGNLVGSGPVPLQFGNSFMPAVATSEIDYNANLPSVPRTTNENSSVVGSELLNPADFSANPINGAPVRAQILGSGAALSPDAVAVATGSQNISTLTSAGGTLVINGTTITVTAGDDATAIMADINAQTGTTGVAASLNTSNQLVLTSADASTNVTIGSTSTLSLRNELGLSVGTTTATNILTQSAAATGQTLTFAVGANPPLTVTFGTGVGQVNTLAQLTGALGGLVGGTASVDSSGNITVTAANNSDTVTVSGTATPTNFGIHTLIGVPSNGTVIANDLTAFLNSSVSGGAVTAYNDAGSPINVQLRWAKVDSTSLGSGHTDTWNLFYQVDSNATSTQAAWQNTNVNFGFSSDGQMTPPLDSTTINNVVVNGVSLGNVRLVFGSGGLTQFADPNGTVQVNKLIQNGFAAGQLQSFAVGADNRITGTFSNGRTIDLAQVTLANFSGADNLKAIGGSAYQATPQSGAPNFNTTGTVEGSSLENSNADIADQFTKLIVTQQAYSANTRVITTTNQMAQDLLNIVR